MRSLAAAALLLASCYHPDGQCSGDGDCLADQRCGPDALCIAGTRPPPGDAPVAVADAYAFSGASPFDVSAPGVLANDANPGGGTLVAVIVPAGTARTSAGGTVFLAPDGSFTYALPVQGFVGADTFRYRATNGVTTSAETIVSLTVGP